MNDLQKLERKMEQLDRDIQKVNKSAPKASKAIKGIGASSRTAAKGVGTLSKAFAKITLVLGALKSLSFVFTSTAELETQTKSLQVLTGSLEKTKGIITELQDFGSVTPFTSTELIETAKRLKAFGVDTEKLVDTTKRLGDVSGATGARLEEVATAYGQIQAKGRLQGEELLQLQERGIGLQDELQKMYNLTGEEFTKALSKGQFSAEAVEQAIINLTDKGGKYADGAIAQSTTLAGRFSTLIDRVTKLAQIIGDALKPAVDFVLNAAINATNQIIRLINFANRILGIGTENRVNKLQAELDKLEAGGRFRSATQSRADRIKQLRTEIEQLKGETIETVDAAEQLEAVTQNVPKLRGSNPSSSADGDPYVGQNVGGNTSSISAPSGFFDEANQFEELLERQEESRDRIFQALTRELALGRDISDTQRTLLQLDYEILDLKKDISSTVAESDQAELFALAEKLRKQKELNILKERNANIVDTFKGIFAEGQAIDDAIKGPFEELATEAIPQVGQAIQESIVSAIDAAVTGTKDLGEELRNIASSLLRQLGGLLINSAFNGFGSALNLPGFKAGGGPVQGGSPYTVGEQGRELFIPNVPGRVIPSDDYEAARAFLGMNANGEGAVSEQEAMADSRNYVTNNSYSSSQAFSESQAALATSTSSTERVFERQMLERQFSNPAPIRLDVETTVINGIEYLTVEQGEAMTAAAVQQAKGQVFSDLKNRPAARRQVGMR